MMAIGDETVIMQFVQRQLWNYSYTFPFALNVRLHSTLDYV